MLARVLGVSKLASGFNHDLRAYARPVNFGRVFRFENLESLAANDNGIRLGPDAFMQLSQNRVVLQ